MKKLVLFLFTCCIGIPGIEASERVVPQVIQKQVKKANNLPKKETAKAVSTGQQISFWRSAKKIKVAALVLAIVAVTGFGVIGWYYLKKKQNNAKADEDQEIFESDIETSDSDTEEKETNETKTSEKKEGETKAPPKEELVNLPSSSRLKNFLELKMKKEMPTIPEGYFSVEIKAREQDCFAYSQMKVFIIIDNSKVIDKSKIDKEAFCKLCRNIVEEWAAGKVEQINFI